MIKVKILTSFPDWPLIRQTEKECGIWGDFKFFINDSSVDDVDFTVVYDGVTKEEKIKCSPNNTLFITGEPRSVKEYDRSFMRQFKYVISSQKNIKHSGLKITQQGLMWMVGGRYNNGIWQQEFSKNYDELKSIRTYEKSKLLSVVLSNKDITNGHIQKNRFVKELKAHFGDLLDVYGVGHDEVEDKWDAIAAYKYHLVLENSSDDHYWTEKISDCYLAGAFPFYYGCDNLNDYFSSQAYVKIDINHVKEAIQIIERALENNTYENSIKKIEESKDLVLDKYNIFPLLVDFIKNNIDINAEKSNLTIKKEKVKQKYFFKLMRKLAKTIIPQGI